MSVLSGHTIRQLCNGAQRMILPFNERQESFGMTFGVGPAGFDVRIEFDREGKQEYFTLHRGCFALASTIERFCMPNDVMGIVHDKSSWARKGLTVQNTVIEPGWSGWLTLELANHSIQDIVLLRGMPIAQVVFHRLDLPAEGYSGKYHNQERGPQAAR